MKLYSRVLVAFLTSALFFSIVPNAHAQEDYWKQNGLTSSYYPLIYSIAINANGDLFAGGEDGVFISTDNGSFWRYASEDLTDVTSVAINSAGNIYAAAHQYLYVSSDGGLEWNQLNTNDYAPWSLMIDSANTIYLGTGSGILISHDNGISWVHTDTGTIAEASIYYITHNAQGDIFAASNGAIFRSSDSGETWISVNEYAGINDFESSIAITQNGAIIAADGSTIYRSSDNGDSWLDLGETNDFSDPQSVVCDSNGTVYVGTDQSGIYRSTDNGTTWRHIGYAALQSYEMYTLVIDANSSLLSGTNNGIIRSTDFGEDWTALHLVLDDVSISHYAANMNGDLFAYDEFSGSLFRTTDDGVTWRQLNFDYYPSSFTCKQNILFAGTDNGVYRSYDNGNSWEEPDDGLANTTISSIVACPNGDLFLANDDGVYHSTNDGDDWLPSDLSHSDGIAFLAVNSLGAVVAGDVSGQTYRSTDNGRTWIESMQFNGLYGIICTTSDYFFAATDDGVYCSKNNGANWGLFNYGIPEGESVTLITSNLIGELFIGTSDYGVYHSTNNGEEWLSINSGLDGDPFTVYSLGVSSRGFVFTDMETSNSEKFYRSVKPSIGPIPLLLAVKDVPQDQGGKVELRWTASPLDTNTATLPYYTIWRALPENKARTIDFTVAGTMGSGLHSETYRIIKMNGKDFYWELIGTQVPLHRHSYSYVAPTLYDEGPTTNGVQFFMVSAQTSDPDVYFDSNPVSGYSVDNLAPAAPKNVAGTLSGGKIVIYWNRNKEHDIQQYLIYRSAHPNIIPDSMEIYGMAAGADSTFTDLHPLPADALYYAVIAEDVHGNRSMKSNEAVVGILGVEIRESKLPKAFALHQNFPNPFNPSTSIQFDIPRTSNVTLKIYNLNGEEISTLASKQMEAGSYSIRWDASTVAAGIYFYRLQAVDISTSSASVFVETKKFILLK